MKFINKIFVNKEDFRGHDCTTFKKNEIDNYLKQINFKPSSDYKRDEVCKGIDISIRTLSSNDTEGKYKYILPEFRHILTPLRQKDFDELLKKKK
jgi:hypothetical protein